MHPTPRFSILVLALLFSSGAMGEGTKSKCEDVLRRVLVQDGAAAPMRPDNRPDDFSETSQGCSFYDLRLWQGKWESLVDNRNCKMLKTRNETAAEFVRASAFNPKRLELANQIKEIFRSDSPVLENIYEDVGAEMWNSLGYIGKRDARLGQAVLDSALRCRALDFVSNNFKRRALYSQIHNLACDDYPGYATSFSYWEMFRRRVSAEHRTPNDRVSLERVLKILEEMKWGPLGKRKPFKAANLAHFLWNLKLDQKQVSPAALFAILDHRALTARDLDPTFPFGFIGASDYLHVCQARGY